MPENRFVERSDVSVMFKRVADEQAAIRRAMADLEKAIGSLPGRKFYGAFDTDGSEYRVCVQLRDGDEAEARAWRWARCRAAATRAYDSLANRQMSTVPSGPRSSAWQSAQTAIVAVRASSFIGAAT
jgi:hypothetical protein